MKTNVTQSKTAKNLNLYGAKHGKSYVVKDAPDLGILKCLGVHEGAEIFKKHDYRLGGPVLLMIGTCELAIGKDIAEQISISEVN